MTCKNFFLAFKNNSINRKIKIKIGVISWLIYFPHLLFEIYCLVFLLFTNVY